MAIEIFEGRIGSGKSYAAVRKIAAHLADGLTACTNIAINWQGLVAFVANEYGVEIQPEQLIDLQDVDIGEFHRVTPMGSPGAPVLVVLDECHLAFNARDWNQTSRELLAFLTQSRKQDTDIVFISQSAENIDKQFRRLVQYVWRFRDLRKTTVPGLGMNFNTMIQVVSFGLMSGEVLLACQYDYDGKTLMSREFVSMDKRVFAAYDTKALLSSFMRSGQRGRLKMERRRGRRAFAILRVVMLLVLIAGVVLWWRWRSSSAEAKQRETVTGQAASKGVTRPGAVLPAVEVVPMPAASQQPAALVSVVHSGAPRFHTPAAGADLREMSEEARAEYDIYQEQFVRFQTGRNMPGPVLKTLNGVYRKGAMSARGYVLGVEDRQACVVQPNGRMGWVVAEEGNGTPVDAAPQAVIPPPPKPPKVDPPPHERSLAELEEERIKNELARPIGMPPKEWAKVIARRQADAAKISAEEP